MKSIFAVMAAGLMAVLLTGCGQETPKQPEVKTETVVVKPAAEKPAAEKPADAVKTETTETTTTAPAEATKPE